MGQDHTIHLRFRFLLLNDKTISFHFTAEFKASIGSEKVYRAGKLIKNTYGVLTEHKCNNFFLKSLSC